MKSRTLVLAAALVAATLAGVAEQSSNDGAAHRAAAVAAAGQDHLGLLAALCPATPPERGQQAAAAGQAAGRGQQGRGSAPPAPRGLPPREQWHAEPVKVFDNLYWFGQTEYSVWAVTTSQGIIVIDTIFDYSVQDEVVDGMRKLGLDPTTIKYAIEGRAGGSAEAVARHEYLARISRRSLRGRRPGLSVLSLPRPHIARTA